MQTKFDLPLAIFQVMHTGSNLWNIPFMGSNLLPITPIRPKLVWVVPDLSFYHHARINAFANLGVAEVVVIEMCDTSGFKEFKKSAFPDAGYCLMTLFKGRYYSEIPTAEACVAINKALDGLEPDLLLVQGWADIFALAAIRWLQNTAKIGIVATESQFIDDARKPWKEWIKRRLIRRFSSGLAGGSSHVAYLKTLGVSTDRIFSGYDVVDNDHFATGAAEARKREEPFCERHCLARDFFLASGRFIKRKNYVRLLQAFALYRKAVLLQNGEPWNLVLLGGGPQRMELEHWVGELSLSGHVQMPGFKGYDELPGYYGMAGAFIHASTVEQWGLVVNEAMAAGLPVLVSNRCGCAADLVADGENGFRFDPFDTNELALLMERLTSKECDVKGMGQCSLKKIAQWSPQTFAEGLSQAVKVAQSYPRPKMAWFDKVLVWSLLRR
ncbi:MAG: glycosyltransferase [Chthoniobacteraceae bacterium]